MKTVKRLLLVLVILMTGMFWSCENNDTAETDSLYEVHNVDKRDVERPGDQGGN